MLNNAIKLAGQKQNKLYNMRYTKEIIGATELIMFIAFMFICLRYGLNHLTTMQ